MSAPARLALLVAAFSLLSLSRTPAQSSSPPSPSPQLIPRTHDQREQKYQNLHRVYLSVQVTTPNGQPVEDLQPSDFTLLQDQQPHPIVSVRSIRAGSAGLPARIVLVVDAVNNSAGKVASFRKDIATYLQSGAGPLPNPTSIALLSERGFQFGPSSTDRADVLRQLNNLAGDIHSLSCRDTTFDLEGGAMGGPRDPNPKLGCLDHLFDSSTNALNSLAESLFNSRSKSNQPQRTILLWMGRGWPLLNQRGYTPDTPEIKAGFYHSLVTISSALTEAQATLHAVASTEVLPVSQKHLSESYFFQGVSSPNDATAASLSLQAFAWQSGGLVLNSTRNIAGQIARCVADAQSYYLLAFDYPPAPAFGQYHTLAIKLDRLGLVLRTRTLYYAEQ